MGAISKVVQNFGPRAMAVLGPTTYCRALLAAAITMPDILRTRTMTAMDRRMSSQPIRARFRGTTIVVDAPAANHAAGSESFPYGLVRELLIRNCYLREGIAEAFDDARTVLDLGANLGVFTIMAAVGGRKVIAVEVLPPFAAMVRHHLELNGATNFAVENCFIGKGGAFASRRPDDVGFSTIPELMRKHRIEILDLIKIDIEGSEFALFADEAAPDWLNLTRAICMEVHPAVGQVKAIIDRLDQLGYEATVTDTSFRPVTDLQNADFIYAINGSLRTRGAKQDAST